MFAKEKFHEWIKRLKKNQPSQGSFLRVKKIETSVNDDFIVVSLFGVNRFSVDPITGDIHGIKRNKIVKKEHYGNLDSQDAWNWDSYYPYKKVCKNEDEKKITGKEAEPGRSLADRFPLNPDLPIEAWPYTTGSRRPVGNE